MLTIRKMLAHIICQTIEWEVNYFTAKEKCYFGFYFQVRVSKISSADSVSHSCSFCIRRYSPCCKPVKPGHYSVLGSRILRALLTLYGKVTEEWNNKCKWPFVCVIFSILFVINCGQMSYFCLFVYFFVCF